MRLSWSNHLLICLTLETLMSIISTIMSIYSGGTNRPVEFCYNFYILSDLIQKINFPTCIPDSGLSQSYSFGFIYFLWGEYLFCNAFSSIGKSWSWCCLSFIDFPSNWKRIPHLNCIACDYSFVNWDGFCDHFRDAPREDIFKLGAPATASEFCDWVQLGVDVYIPHCKYQVKPHYLSP